MSAARNLHKSRRFLASSTVLGALALQGCANLQTEDVTIRTTGAATNVVRLTQSSDDELNPAISPDGKLIAFQGLKGDQYEIYTVDSTTGLSRTQVTNHGGQDIQPTWLPDSKTLVFTSSRLGTPSLWKQLATGAGGCTMVTRGGDMSDYAPDVAAVGSPICFHSLGVGQYELQVRATGISRYTVFKTSLPHIWKVGLDGTSLTEFGEGARPTWAPDASTIAFCSDVSGNWDIWSMAADGTSVTQLTTNDHNQIDPHYSPDGKWITYVSDEGGDYDLWIMKADGSSPTQLTSDVAEDATPTWSAAGEIVFCSKKSGNWDIWKLTPVLPE